MARRNSPRCTEINVTRDVDNAENAILVSFSTPEPGVARKIMRRGNRRSGIEDNERLCIPTWVSLQKI